MEQQSQKTPHVTVIIANYNYGQWVLGAIESIRKQDYENISVVVIDDCSKDDSWEKLNNKYNHPGFCELIQNEYCSGFHQPTYHSNSNFTIACVKLNKNSGPSEARNVGMNLALELYKPDVFAILDADDEYYPNKISRCIKTLYSVNSIGVVYSDYDILNTLTNIKVREYKEIYSKNRLQESCIVHSGALIKAVALESVKEETGFYDKRIKGPEDYDLWLRIAEKFMIIHIPESLSLVRHTGNNISASNHVEFNENYKNGFEIINRKIQERQNAKH